MVVVGSAAVGLVFLRSVIGTIIRCAVVVGRETGGLIFVGIDTVAVSRHNKVVGREVVGIIFNRGNFRAIFGCAMAVGIVVIRFSVIGGVSGDSLG